MLDGGQRQYGFGHALVPIGSTWEEYLEGGHGWILVERSPAAALYRRVDRDEPAKPAAWAEMSAHSAGFFSSSRFDKPRF